MAIKLRENDEQLENSKSSNAYEVALEFVKQLITLASGVLAISATFIGRFKDVPVYLLFLLAISWFSLAVSIFFGLETISVIIESRLKNNDNWSEGRGRASARICKYSFVVGIALFAFFVFLSLVLC